MPRVLCLLSARNLGDAVMHAGALDALHDAGFAERYLVWTFPQAAFLFAGRPGVEVWTSSFPMGATRDACLKDPRSFVAALRALRRARPTHTLDLIGDIRERVVARLLGAASNTWPLWAPDHPFRQHVRGVGRGLRGRGGVPVPADIANIYDAQRLVLAAMAGRPLATRPARRPSEPRRGNGPRIGIHPYASLPCKLWPMAHWRATLAALRTDHPDATFVLFGPPTDAADLHRLAADAGVAAEVFTAGLPAFYERVGTLDLLLGLDSVAIHVAHRQGVPSLALIGPNDPRVFTPPTTTALTQYGHCVYQPCHGKPRCEGSSFEYVCMRAIEPARVVAAVGATQAGRDAAVFRDA